MGYLVLEFDFSKNKLMSINVFAEMESAMEYVKETIRHLIITSDEGLGEGDYVMLDSADEHTTRRILIMFSMLIIMKQTNILRDSR